MTATRSQKARARRLYDELMARYPDAHCALDYSSPSELLIATILSAQATDVGVNKATPALFAAFPKPSDFAAASPQDIEPFVSSINFYRNKAKAIHAAMRRLEEAFGGEVPDTMEDLLSLRGVARKTANVVLGNAFNKNEGVVVDTHVSRVSQRFGLTVETKPERIERDLMDLYARPRWTMLSHLLIRHGREVCKARASLCAEDPICQRYSI